MPLVSLGCRNFLGYAWSRTSIRSRGIGTAGAGRISTGLWERIAAAFPDARADHRDGLRLEWDDRWVHVRASNTEPIVRVIAEAAEAAEARRALPHGSVGGLRRPRSSAMSYVGMAPLRPEPPSVAFVDVDGTLLAQTTTFLFARILYRRGLIRRSFFLRALYHGLQHRFGRLDYGRLIEIGLTLHPAHPGHRTRTDRLRELRRARPATALRGGRRTLLVACVGPGRRSCWSPRRPGW